MLTQIADLGFEYVELSHGIRINLVPGILKAVGEGVIKVSSTHNFCPLPTGINQPAPNLYSPASPDLREHQQWLRHTLRSLEFSRQVGARYMVTHMGHVRFFWGRPSEKMKKIFAEGPEAVHSDRYKKASAKMIQKVRKKMPPHWEQLRMSLEEILSDADRCNVIIGAENREGCEELPLDSDFPEFFRQAQDHKNLGWWQDVGHARIKERLGLLNHRQFMVENEKKLCGFHLHDVSADGRDHQTIGTGTVDFEMVSTFFRPEHAFVLELSPRLTVEEITQSRDYVEALIARSPAMVGAQQ
jgi:sugar phosphate isomerase/epimerase